MVVGGDVVVFQPKMLEGVEDVSDLSLEGMRIGRGQRPISML